MEVGINMFILVFCKRGSMLDGLVKYEFSLLDYYLLWENVIYSNFTSLGTMITLQPTWGLGSKAPGIYITFQRILDYGSSDEGWEKRPSTHFNHFKGGDNIWIQE